MAAADVVCQRLQHSHKSKWKWDAQRTARFGIVGLTLHGPYFLWGFGTLDRVFGPSTSLLTAAKKTATGQCTLFPVYLTAFFTYMGLLEGLGMQGALDKLAANFVPSLVVGTAFWPVANMINFRYVAPTQRVLYVNACGLVWNAALSYINHQMPPTA